MIEFHALTPLEKLANSRLKLRVAIQQPLLFALFDFVKNKLIFKTRLARQIK
jgi:hypothetical protein